LDESYTSQEKDNTHLESLSVHRTTAKASIIYEIMNSAKIQNHIYPDSPAPSAPFEEEYKLDEPTPTSKDPVDVSGRVLGGAAAAGGIAGLVFAGPVVGVVAGAGAAVVATTHGKAGKVLRKSGEAMAVAGDRLKQIDKKHHVVEKTSKGMARAGDRLKQIDDKHHVVEKTSKGMAAAGDRLKHINEKHHVVEKTSKGMAAAGDRLKHINEKHHVVERTSKSITKSAKKVAKAMRKK